MAELKYYNITAESIYNIIKIRKPEFCRNFIAVFVF